MNLNIFLLILMMLGALWTVMTRSLLKATIGLAVTSAVLSILIFRLNSPLAAVFELSVCSGLITVVFVSTISLTRPLSHKETIAVSRDRFKRFWYLFPIMIIAAILLSFLKIPVDVSTALPRAAGDVRDVMWNSRQLDLFGQILVIIAGALGVVMLFTEAKKDGS